MSAVAHGLRPITSTSASPARASGAKAAAMAMKITIAAPGTSWARSPSLGRSAADALAQQRFARFRATGGGVLADERGRAAGHGLLHRERKSLADARQDEQIRCLVERAKLLGRGTVHDGRVRQPPARRIEGSPTREQPVRVGKALRQLTQHGESFLLHESAEEEEQRLVRRNAEPQAMRAPLLGRGGAETLRVDAVLHQHGGAAKARETAKVPAHRL